MPDATPTEHHLKLDPGSKVTGLALLQGDKVVWAAELTHRGGQIKKKLDSRRSLRRGRRARLRHRKPRYHTKGQIRNAKRRYKDRKKLQPSLQHRVETTMTWVKRIQRYCSVGKITQELVRFDTQKMQDPEISGTKYQQGELQGYEAKEYLLEKWGRKCAYCGVKNAPLEVEHILAKSRGGSNRISNLTLACVPCNQRKGNQPVEVFLKRKPQVLQRVLAQLNRPLRDAAAVNATKNELLRRLEQVCSVVAVGTGGQTKYNRKRFGVAKSHWGDAACTGEMDSLRVLVSTPLLIAAKGQGGRQRATVNRYGYPTRHRPLRPILGWRSGDIGKCEGKVGRVTPRSNGSFKLAPLGGAKAFDRNVKKFKRTHRQDGFTYD